MNTIDSDDLLNVPEEIPADKAARHARRGGDENWEDPQADAATVVPTGDD